MGEVRSLGHDPEPPKSVELHDAPGVRRTKRRPSGLKQSAWYRLPKVEKMASFITTVTGHGWKVTSRGWPKFLCWSPSGEISLAYVLKDGKRLSRVQRFVAYQFARCGIAVYTFSKSGGFKVFDPQAYRLAYAQQVATRPGKRDPLDPDPVRPPRADDTLYASTFSKP